MPHRARRLVLPLILCLGAHQARACEPPSPPAPPTEAEARESRRIGAEEFRRTLVIIHGRILSLRAGPAVGENDTQYLRIFVDDAIKGASPGDVLTVRKTISECADGGISPGATINVSAVYMHGRLVEGGGGDWRLWRPYLAEVARTRESLDGKPDAERAIAMAGFYLDNGDPRLAMASLGPPPKGLPPAAKAMLRARAEYLMDLPRMASDGRGRLGSGRPSPQTATRSGRTLPLR